MTPRTLLNSRNTTDYDPDAHHVNGTEWATKEGPIGLRRIADDDFPEPMYCCHKGLKTLLTLLLLAVAEQAFSEFRSCGSPKPETH
jgi:hypothetical protein